MKVYRGKRVYKLKLAEDGALQLKGRFVTVDGKPLKPRRNIRNHSEEYERGYEGSGPSQLALAVMYDYFETAKIVEEWDETLKNSPIRDKQTVKKYTRLFYHEFKRDFLAEIRSESWEITSEQIDNWLRSKDLPELLHADAMETIQRQKDARLGAAIWKMMKRKRNKELRVENIAINQERE
jgi:hypothetical protein